MVDTDLKSECAICGKKIFFDLYGSVMQYAYKRHADGKHGKLIYFCSYTCLREYDKKKGIKTR